MADFNPTPRKDQTLVSGTRGPENILANRVVVEMDQTIHEYLPEVTPLLTLTSKTRDKRKVNNYKFEWLWKDQYPRKIKLTAASAIGDTSLTVSATDDDKPVAGDILMNLTTNENVRVTSTAANTINVTRAISGAEVEMLADQELMIIGRAAEDGATKGTFVSIKDEAEYNYTQIFRTGFGTTWRLRVTNLYGGKDPVTEKKAQGIKHRQDIELTAFFGSRYAAAGTSHYITATGGLNYFTKSNRWDLGGGVPTKAAFTRFLEDAMRWGDGGYLNGRGDKWMFCSSHWMTIFEEWYKDQIRYKPLDTKLGIVPGEIHTTHGIVRLVKTPILDDGHADRAFLVDMNHVRYVFMESYDTKLLTNIQANDAATEENEYYTDCGWQINLEGAHAALFNLSLS